MTDLHQRRLLMLLPYHVWVSAGVSGLIDKNTRGRKMILAGWMLMRCGSNGDWAAAAPRIAGVCATGSLDETLSVTPRMSVPSRKVEQTSSYF
jgi:hypothetical protein